MRAHRLVKCNDDMTVLVALFSFLTAHSVCVSALVFDFVYALTMNAI